MRVIVIVLVLASAGAFLWFRGRLPSRAEPAAKVAARRTNAAVASRDIRFAVNPSGEIGPAEQVSVGQPFRIIGVFQRYEPEQERKRRGLRLAGALPLPDPHLSAISIKVRDIDPLDQELQQARNVLMLHHRCIEDFGFNTKEDWSEQIGTAIKNARA